MAVILKSSFCSFNGTPFQISSLIVKYRPILPIASLVLILGPSPKKNTSWLIWIQTAFINSRVFWGVFSVNIMVRVSLFYCIPPLTLFQGIVTVADGVELDREENATITLTVTAYDSPNNPDVRRYVQIPVKLWFCLYKSTDCVCI